MWRAKSDANSSGGLWNEYKTKLRTGTNTYFNADSSLQLSLNIWSLTLFSSQFHLATVDLNLGIRSGLHQAFNLGLWQTVPAPAPARSLHRDPGSAFQSPPPGRRKDHGGSAGRRGMLCWQDAGPRTTSTRGQQTMHLKHSAIYFQIS